MKRLSIICALLMLAMTSFADKGAMVLTGPDLLQVNAVSPNGKWACGNVGDGTYTIIQGVLWNLQTGEITYLSSADESSANDVADDGTVVGSYTNYTLSGNGTGVEVAGYYKDGVWTAFENSTIPGISRHGGTVYAISRDGRSAVGYVMKGGDFVPAKWEDGYLKLIYKYEYGDGMCYTISDDGRYASGWAYTPDSEGDLNRTIALWTDTTVEYLSPAPTFVEAGRHFSPDNSWLICDSFGYRFIYNLNTKEKVTLEWYSPDCWGQNVCYVDNNGYALGGETFQSADGSGGTYGIIWIDGKPQILTNWLKTTYNVVIDTEEHNLFRGVDMSDDGKVIATLDYPRAAKGAWSSTIILLDREVDFCPPVALKAEKIRGINSVRLTWNEPLMNASNVIGYNLYRDGVKVLEGVNELAYIDAVPAEGVYNYSVTALYEGENDDFIESEHSVTCTINVVAEPANPVSNIVTHSVNYNDLKLRWLSPKSNLPAVTYFDAEQTTAGFGGGLVSFSSAIRMPLDVVANYADKFCLARVSFMPRHPEAIYTIKVYVNNVEKVSQTVDNALLVYNNMNTFDLNTPVQFGEYDDIVVAVDIDASHFTAASNDVIGMSYGNVVSGYSDLLRQLVEPEYYSLNQSNIDAGYGEMPVSWAITAIFAPMGEDGKPMIDCDILQGYDVYRDNNLLGTVESNSYFDQNIPRGEHTYGVAARYADGSVANPTTININFQPKTEALSAIDNVTVTSDLTFVSARWNAPLNNDKTVLSYANGKNTGRGMLMAGATELIEYTVAHEYPASYFEWYEGYNIEALRFYPTGEAVFAIALEVNGIDHELIVLGEMGEKDGYTLNTWNTVKLSQPYKIEPGNIVRVKLVCSEVDPTTYPICMDNSVGSSMYTDLYSWDYSHFSSAHIDGGLSGSWMLGMVVSNDNTEVLPVKGYNVLLDGEQLNNELVATTQFRKDGLTLADGSTHRLRVNVVYDVEDEREVEGQQVIFNVTAGIEDIIIDRVKVYPNPATSFIAVEGETDKLELIDLSGRTVATSMDGTIDVTTVPVGSYLLNIYRKDDMHTVKVVVAR